MAVIRSLVMALLVLTAASRAQTGAALIVRLAAPDGPATSAEVVLRPQALEARADIPGEVRFDGLPAGDYELEIRADGFALVDTAIHLEPGEPQSVFIVLRPLAATLAEIVVETDPRDGTRRTFQRPEIEASAARTLPEFLERATGLEVRTDGTAGAVVTAGIGGSNANQVLVLVDGRRVQTMGSGEADLASIPLEWVESVRVYRGSRVESGGEAIGGVLEIATRAPGTRSEVRAGVEVEPTSHRLMFQRSGKSGPLASLLSFTRTQGPGDFLYKKSEDDGTGEFTVDLGKQFRRQNADVARDQLFAKIAAPLGADGDVELSSTLDRAVRGMPGYLAPQLTPRARQATQNGAYQLRAQKSVGAVRLSGSAALQNDERVFENPDALGPLKRSTESSRQWEGWVDAAGPAARAYWSAGAQVARETLTSSQLTGGTASRNRWALWTGLRTPLLSDKTQRWQATLNPGLRWEGYGTDRAWLPGVKAGFEHSPSYRYGFTVGWGRSYRAPTFYSLFWLDDQVARGNPDLAAETSREWTGRAYFETEAVNRTRLDIAVSDQQVENLIYWKRGFDNHWKPFNLKDARIRTLDIDVEQSVWHEHVALQAGLNWTEARDATDDRNTGGRYLTFRAPHTQRASLLVRARGAVLAVNHRRVAARPVLETNSKWLRAYEITDLTVTYRFRLGRVHLEPGLSVNNLFNENYRIIRHAPMPGREVSASIHLSYP